MEIEGNLIENNSKNNGKIIANIMENNSKHTYIIKIANIMEKGLQN